MKLCHLHKNFHHYLCLGYFLNLCVLPEITFHSAVILYPSHRSSYSCRYFVLPCCFFDFHGKYSRKQSKKTQYREYLDFVAEVGSVCGFHVEEDCLRIPSTKRVILDSVGLLSLFLKVLCEARLV